MGGSTATMAGPLHRHMIGESIYQNKKKSGNDARHLWVL